MTRMIALSAMVLGLVACSSAPPPQSVARAEQAIQAAQTAGAQQAAPLDLQQANERLSSARAIAGSDTEQADRLAQEAIADAQLAQARAEAVHARSALDNVRRSGAASEGVTP